MITLRPLALPPSAPTVSTMALMLWTRTGFDPESGFRLRKAVVRRHIVETKLHIFVVFLVVVDTQTALFSRTQLKSNFQICHPS